MSTTQIINKDWVPVYGGQPRAMVSYNIPAVFDTSSSGTYLDLSNINYADDELIEGTKFGYFNNYDVYFEFVCTK